MILLKTMLMGFLALTSQADFSGTWQLRGKPGSSLSISLANSRLHVINGKLDLTYEINGPEIVYTGTDGDEFHSKLTWEADHFLFTIVEHERGRLIPATETWSILDSGQTLKRVKQSNRDGKASERVSLFDRR